MTIGKTVDNDKVSMFTKDGMFVYKEYNVLITYKCEPIPIGEQDKRSRCPILLYRIVASGNQKKQPRKQKVSSAGQPPLWPPIGRRGSQIDIHSVWLSPQVDMDQGHQIRKLLGMANVKWAPHQLIFSTQEY